MTTLIDTALSNGWLSIAPAEPKRRMRRNLSIRRQDYPPGPAGVRQFNTDYQRELRRVLGLKPHARRIPVARDDYPRTDAGHKAWRRAYGIAWRRAKANHL